MGDIALCGGLGQRHQIGARNVRCGIIRPADGRQKRLDDMAPRKARTNPKRTWSMLSVGAVALALALSYAATLQTHISGSFPEKTPALVLKNEYIKDVAEIQVALNLWGTIHHTGYPLFAILGNLFTAPLRALGVEPAAAASLYALAWGALALLTLGVMLWRLTGRAWLAALSVLVLGLTRSVWLHNVVAEVYSMSLAITALLWAVALWPAQWEGKWRASRRVLWLALLGGVGVAHHRAVIFVAPGLLWALWPHLRAERGVHWLRLGAQTLALGLLGFVPYVYLPLRARQGAPWVYGEPGTLRGLWIEFSGKEADRLVKLPADLAALWANVTDTWGILARELTLPGLLIVLAGVTLAVTRSPRRHEARALTLSALGPLLFAVFYHTAVLPQAILMPVVAAFVLTSALALDGALRGHGARVQALSAALLVVWAGALWAWNVTYIRELVREPSGQETIARMARIPREGKAAFMLPWGPRYAAAAYASLVTGDRADVRVLDHKADYRQWLAQGYRLYTEPETFYTYPPPWQTAYGAPADWWPQHFGDLYLTSAAPQIVELLPAPQLAATDAATPITGGIALRDAWLTCDEANVYLHVRWQALAPPQRDPSVFVHLTPDDPVPNPPGADRRHPVYGLYPFARWQAGEIVRDDFALPRLAGMTQVRFGLYEQNATGQFINYGETALPIADCQTTTP